MHLIQEDLFKTAFEWNTHRIRLIRSSPVPSGHPEELYCMPQLQGQLQIILTIHNHHCIIGTQNYLCDVSARDLTVCKEYSEAPAPPGTVEFLEMAQCLMSAHNLTFPKTLEEATNLYVTMTTILEHST